MADLGLLGGIGAGLSGFADTYLKSKQQSIEAQQAQAQQANMLAQQAVAARLAAAQGSNAVSERIKAGGGYMDDPENYFLIHGKYPDQAPPPDNKGLISGGFIPDSNAQVGGTPPEGSLAPAGKTGQYIPSEREWQRMGSVFEMNKKEPETGDHYDYDLKSGALNVTHHDPTNVVALQDLQNKRLDAAKGQQAIQVEGNKTGVRPNSPLVGGAVSTGLVTDPVTQKEMAMKDLEAASKGQQMAKTAAETGINVNVPQGQGLIQQGPITSPVVQQDLASKQLGNQQTQLNMANQQARTGLGIQPGRVTRGAITDPAALQDLQNKQQEMGIKAAQTGIGSMAPGGALGPTTSRSGITDPKTLAELKQKDSQTRNTNLEPYFKLKSQYDENSATKDVREAAFNLQKMLSAKDSNSPTAQKGMVYNYIRIENPGSIAREGQLEDLRKVPDLMRQYGDIINQATTGSLSKKSIDDMARAGIAAYQGARDVHQKVQNDYNTQGKQLGIPTTFTNETALSSLDKQAAKRADELGPFVPATAGDLTRQIVPSSIMNVYDRAKGLIGNALGNVKGPLGGASNAAAAPNAQHTSDVFGYAKKHGLTPDQALQIKKWNGGQ